MTTAQMLDKLESITKKEQFRGTKKLEKAGIIYNDNTIQGVMENIPESSSNATIVTGFDYSSVPVLKNALSGGTEYGP